MLEVKDTSQFSKDLKKAKRRGKDLKKLKTVTAILARGETLDPKYKDHKLRGKFKGMREFHLEPDWVVIYEIDRKKNQLILHEMGSHSDLF